ncbi:hypothetical protein C5C31_14705 [Rathayibacter rathayi]|uniref:leucine zipper domain-containing protein n=1 Tax=Rathayibacter rathayi TaxID=33887 RepID=UPI000BCFE529|nr:leucine zipper domain-containing protein [Rathayibacter rathayi]MWV76019.1 helix-turn-helix domain-containing protein [Rathayibacter rathayi NCPPB 2980 = VKM Ac-1601]PPF18808.1 hypothetical protein C5C34_15410 [Rathayibacter rathayi]PPF41942.1 hypothetical protein C5C08_15560 [Rathayibacter rathayi]PPF74688.1 hypothetical protein C5C14_15430 [Rathayibacter rathayi]PPG08403.1 hypothetical protein C5C11_15790 [Rathayibacter rathayi]
MSHANAALTPRHSERIGRLVIEDGWTIAATAAFFHVSWPTTNRWAKRFAEMGSAGMLDRSSRPHRSPARTPPAVVKKIVHLRWKKRLGPVQIGGLSTLRTGPDVDDNVFIEPTIWVHHRTAGAGALCRADQSSLSNMRVPNQLPTYR